MKNKICSLIKYEWKFKIVHFSIMIITLLIAITMFRYKDYSLQLPGKNLFANITFTIVIFIGIISYFILNIFEKRNIGIEKIYLCLVIPLCIMYCIANPLGKIPDEDQHARKSYMISQGVFFSEKDNVGNPIGVFDSNINEIVSRKITSYEEALSKILNEEKNSKIVLNYSMATYAPICHAPQAVGMFVTRILGAGITVQCYAARIVNMSISIFLVYMAIKYIPFKKHVVLFLGLLPITISEFASMSSDALTIGICMFFISYILYLKYSDKKELINRKDITILIISSVIIALCKIVYIPICLLIIILPKEKFSSKKKANFVKVSIIVISIIINLIWLLYASTFLTEVNPNVDAGEQVKYIITHPISYILILFRTIHIYNQTFLMCLCGEGLGHFNAQASVLFTLPCLIVFALIFFVNDNKDRKSFDLFTKVISLIIFVSVVILVYTSLYVAWTPVRESLILGVQSRYFLPALLLTAIVLDNTKIVFNCKLKNKYWISFMTFMNINAISSLVFTYLFNYIIEYYIK